ncbi:MAG: HDIG domain-containing protein [Deltaproteobacteria bacterium]|nr:HDIG domain-containing protein [Deltaproteobacteria bacterium]MBF0508766.1 HDIG domain-containing protein [Deltaproteobacteria bacterium]
MAFTREQAFQLIQDHLKSDMLVKHSLATEVIMRHLAGKLGHDVDTWGLAGLLHDLDYNETKDDMANHGLITTAVLDALDDPVSEEIKSAIRAHNAENLGLTRTSPIDLAITCAETITGLVAATALVYPDKKLASVKPKSVTKRMKEKHFAQGVNRDHIRLCEQLGFSVDDFAALSIEAMKEISDQLGL